MSPCFLLLKLPLDILSLLPLYNSYTKAFSCKAVGNKSKLKYRFITAVSLLQVLCKFTSISLINPSSLLDTGFNLLLIVAPPVKYI